MHITLVGYKDYYKDGVYKGVSVYGVCLDPIPGEIGTCDGHEVVSFYFSGQQPALECGCTYEITFRMQQSRDGIKAYPVGLRKGD